MNDTLLITVTGRDRPGVTSAVFDVLAHAGVSVVDIEQIVVRRRLVLAVLVTAPRDSKRVRDTVTGALAGLGMTVDIEQGSGDNRTRAGGRSHVTVIGVPLRAAAMGAVSLSPLRPKR